MGSTSSCLAAGGRRIVLSSRANTMRASPTDDNLMAFFEPSGVKLLGWWHLPNPECCNGAAGGELRLGNIARLVGAIILFGIVYFLTEATLTGLQMVFGVAGAVLVNSVIMAWHIRNLLE